MTAVPLRVFVGALCFAFSVGVAHDAGAQSAENVAVVINDASADSQRIGEYYAQSRGIPAPNVIHIRTSTDDAIERDEFVRTIELPVGVAIRKAGLQDRVLYLVLTKGVPLRVTGTNGLAGTVASVDSELTLLYRRLLGLPSMPQGKIDNPYFLGDRPIADAKPFSHREQDIYLVTRIDAFTVDQAIGLIDRAKTPGKDGAIVLKQRGNIASAERWIAEAATRLSAQGQASRVVLGGSVAPPDSSVIGYYSSGAAVDRVRGTGLTFTPGSLVANLASADARTFKQPPADWRPSSGADRSAWFEASGEPLIGDVIAEGVTGVAGQVAEPYVLGAVRPDILFPAYLAGFNLAEAFYLSIPTLSWQTVVVGDPLAASFGRPPLVREQLEDAADAVTELPGLFAKRRLALIRAANRDLPLEVAAVLLRVETLMARGDRSAARGALESAVALAPNAVNLMMPLAQLEQEAGQDAAALDLYRRVLTAQPMNVAALNNFAFLLATQGKSPTEALPYAQRAVQLAPRNANTLDTLAWVQHLLGNDGEAAALFDQVVRLAPTQADLRLHAAIVFAAVNQNARAEAELKEALRLNPSLDSNEDVKQLREKLGTVR